MSACRELLSKLPRYGPGMLDKVFQRFLDYCREQGENYLTMRGKILFNMLSQDLLALGFCAPYKD